MKTSYKKLWKLLIDIDRDMKKGIWKDVLELAIIPSII